MRNAAAARSSQPPTSCAARAERVRGHVADPARERVLEIGPREFQQRREALRDFGRARELRARALEARDVGGAREPQQIERRRTQCCTRRSSARAVTEIGVAGAVGRAALRALTTMSSPSRAQYEADTEPLHFDCEALSRRARRARHARPLRTRSRGSRRARAGILSFTPRTAGRRRGARRLLRLWRKLRHRIEARAGSRRAAPRPRP